VVSLTYSQFLSLLTSNVVYDKKIEPTPDGRKAGQPFVTGCNSMHEREFSGAIFSQLPR